MNKTYAAEKSVTVQYLRFKTVKIQLHANQDGWYLDKNNLRQIKHHVKSLKGGWFWTINNSRYLCKYTNLCRQHWCPSNWNCDPDLNIMNFQGWNRNELRWGQLVNLYTTIGWGGIQHLVVLRRKQCGQVNKGIVHPEQAFWFA